MARTIKEIEAELARDGISAEDRERLQLELKNLEKLSQPTGDDLNPAEVSKDQGSTDSKQQEVANSAAKEGSEALLNMVTKNPDMDGKAAGEIASAISNQIFARFQKNQEQRGETGEDIDCVGDYGTDRVYNMIMKMLGEKFPDNVENIPTRARFCHAIGNILAGTRNPEVKAFYNNEKVNTALSDTFLNAITGQDVASTAFAIHSACYASGEETINFFTKQEGLADKMIGDFTNPDFGAIERGMVGGALCALMSNKDFAKNISTTGNLTAVLGMNNEEATDYGKGNTALTIAKMIEANPDLKEEKGAEARKALLGFSTVRDPIAIGAVSEALTISSRGENPVIGRTEAQAALMEMGRESSDPRAIGSVCNAIARINWDHHKDASNDGVATHAFIQEMIGKVEKTPGSDGVRTRGDLAMAIATSCDTQEGRDKFCNKFTKGQILDWSKKAKTNEDIHRFAFALGTMAYHEGRAAESGGLFCGDKEVQGALNDMGNKITAGNGSEEAKAATDLALANVGSTAAVDKAVLQHKEDAQQQPGKDPQDPSAEPLEKRQVEAVH